MGLERFILYAVSLIATVVGASELWGLAAAKFAGGVHLLIGSAIGILDHRR